MGWKEVSRKTLVGPETKLYSIEGDFWIKPRKLSIQASDELAEISRTMFRSGDLEKTKQFRDLMKRFHEEGKTVEEGIAGMDPLDLMQITPPQDKSLRAKMYEIAMLHGIGEHNLTDDKDKIIFDGKVLDAKTVKEILEEASPLAAEIYEIVQAFNSPLPKGSGSTSPTSLNGSSTEPSSSQEISSPTDESRRDS